ncbi:unnamed protein product [Acanthoscelides obtectus]|uniref:MADF domain-containing protein n=1 Tax=Acanthoscelides obtectus TaxID=200917 RepID=A0A9P0LCX2_ACAOB|nr:unnamed protein product [Acanthoscelides obtectus]CAK1649081.1 hypothetical protein AOBTE_LOCUS16025 [Acanthoscelides obtectus]
MKHIICGVPGHKVGLQIPDIIEARLVGLMAISLKTEKTKRKKAHTTLSSSDSNDKDLVLSLHLQKSYTGRDDSDDDPETFSDLENDILYNKTFEDENTPENRITVKKDAAWQELAEIVHMEVQEIKKEMDGLRGSFHREKSRMEKGTGSGKGKLSRCDGSGTFLLNKEVPVPQDTMGQVRSMGRWRFSTILLMVTGCSKSDRIALYGGQFNRSPDRTAIDQQSFQIRYPDIHETKSHLTAVNTVLIQVKRSSRVGKVTSENVMGCFPKDVCTLCTAETECKKHYNCQQLTVKNYINNNTSLLPLFTMRQYNAIKKNHNYAKITQVVMRSNIMSSITPQPSTSKHADEFESSPSSSEEAGHIRT